MTSSSTILKPHSFFENQTHEQFCEKMPEFYFRKEVPEDVIQNFEVVKALMVHSYYEYKFIDEALSKALTSFEMAMSIRYKDFYAPKKMVTFNELLIKLSEKKLFDTSFHQLKAIKSMRNHFTHPQQHGFGGVVFWGRVEFVARLVNEMYEDVDLRSERNFLWNEFHEFQEIARLANGLVIDIDGKQSILHRMQLLLINNKFNPPSYFFICTPMFDFSISENGSYKYPGIFKSKLIDVDFHSKSFTGTSFSAKSKITFTSIDSFPEMKSEYENWLMAYNNSKNKIHFDSVGNLYINDWLKAEISEFQKM